MRKTEDYTVPFVSERKIKVHTLKKNSYIQFSEIFDTVIISFIILTVVFSFFCRFLHISGPSMENTLHDKNLVLVSSTKSNYSRGDVVIIGQPNAMEESLVKRVIAVGGDIIDINFATGDIFVNGDIIQESYIKEKTRRSFDIEFPVKVEEGKVFVMGDNRNNSLDSRSSVIGQIDERYILGVVSRSIIPWKKI
ncbi:MAG: signal peptidase I [Clostridiales bacterium]|nr:signal peptidase I [Clostridiales bacterium]